MYGHTPPFNSRVSQLHQLNDGVGYDQISFVELKQLKLAASSAKDADHTFFLQDFPMTFPLTFRAFSVHAHTGDGSNAQVHNITPYGHYAWNPTYAIYMNHGVVAYQSQDTNHPTNPGAKIVEGYTTTEDSDASKNGTDNRSQVELISGGTDSAQSLDAENIAHWWLEKNGEDLSRVVNFTASPSYEFQVYDDNTPGYSQTDPGNSIWHYVRDVQFDATGGQSGGPLVSVRVEPGIPYPHKVAEGYKEEPYHYAPGYTMVNHVTIEQQSDRLFETNGEVSYYFNQVNRPSEVNTQEDHRLAGVYVDEMTDKVFVDPSDNKTLLTPREVAQRQSRRPMTVYSPLWHPFKDSSTSIPLSAIFGKQISFKSSFLHPSETLVYPKKSEYGPDQTHVRPKSADNPNREASNEEIRRGKTTPAKSYSEASNSFNVRMELFLASVDQAEERHIQHAEVYNVCRQPQVYHDRISSSRHSQDKGSKLLDHQNQQTMQGYISEFLILTRQVERMKDHKRYDLRTFLDGNGQKEQAGTYTVSFQYENGDRSVMRRDNQGTSDLQHRLFHKRMPDFGCEGGMHVISAASHPCEMSYTGVFFPSKARQTNFNMRFPNSAFQYKDDEGNTKLSDLINTVYASQFQLILFGQGASYRVHNITDVHNPGI
jgi:hypothetical protein